MGSVSSKPARPGAGGVERRESKTRFERAFSRLLPNREGHSRSGRPVKVMPDPCGTTVPSAARLAVPPSPQVTPVSLSSRLTSSSSSSSCVTPVRTPVASEPPARTDGITWASSAELLPAVSVGVEEGTDEWFHCLSPDRAAQWIRGVAQLYGGATMDDGALDVLCVELGLHATQLGVSQMQAMGHALAQVFNPPATSSSSRSSSSLSAALAAPAGYKGLARVVKALFGHSHPILLPEQAGAFIEGMRLSLPPVLAGADAVLRRAICDAALAGAPTDTVIAMACGLVAGMVDPSAKPVPYSRANLPALPSNLPQQRRDELQDALNMGKRLALQPCSVLDKDVQGTAAEHARWLMIALRMPRPQANEERFPARTRDYAKAVGKLSGQLPTRQRADLLAAVSGTLNQGPLRAPTAADKIERKLTASVQ